MQTKTSSSNSLHFTPDFQAAFDALLHSHDHIFLTGKAGTGKSTLLNYFRTQTKKRLIVLAPTGVAALNVQGETIHSFFRFKSNVTIDDARLSAAKLNNTRLYEEIDTIIIDEISMVRADLIDCMDVFLRTVLNSQLDFGGIQMIWVGDLHQLPPVVTKDDAPFFKHVYTSPYFFSANVMQRGSFKLNRIELKHIFRQDDDRFISFLNHIRHGTLSRIDLDHFNQKACGHNLTLDQSIYLTTTNKQAQHINEFQLSQIDSTPVTFKATYSKSFDLKMAPTDVSLTIKVGSRIMFVNNHQAGIWVNGTIGDIVQINEDADEITVRLDNGIPVTVTPHKWQMVKYVYDSNSRSLQQQGAGTFTQLPIKPAWAITIHKSQGKTFDKTIIDLGRGAFAEGQVYVALSRCRHLDGISLSRPLRQSDIIVSRTVIDWEHS